MGSVGRVVGDFGAPLRGMFYNDEDEDERTSTYGETDEGRRGDKEAQMDARASESNSAAHMLDETRLSV